MKDINEAVKLLNENNWKALQVKLEPFPKGPEAVFYRPDRGAMGLIWHEMEEGNTTKLCVRQPQVDFCSVWRSSVYVTFVPVGVCLPISAFAREERREPRSPGDFHYYRLFSNDIRAISFRGLVK